MDTETAKRKEKKTHHGHNIRCVRRLYDKNQDELAILLNTTQKAIHNLEQEEIIDDKILQQVANVFNLPVEVFKKIQPDDMLEKYVIEITTFSPSMTNGDTSSNNNQNEYIANNQENYTYNYGTDPKYIKLTEDLNRMSERVFKMVSKDLNFESAKNKKLEKEMEALRKELEKLKSGNN
ncbi:helix-turn-helix transcriptional regulator [Dysgonomonas sp. ZJ709]|uniref:helix-turn-helix domain-containing protein n=1 Tax=Dysgonomonas sp. ZJ709 TaxID=2709797 RepID=UPI0013EBD8E0|nr:helix-turn-helix transcriptional regulator [Dysgonomonas sp. ZJ709]